MPDWDISVKKKFLENMMLTAKTVIWTYFNGPIFASCKISKFLEKPLLSKAEKHPEFQVTSCHHFVTTNIKFAYIESE